MLISIGPASSLSIIRRTIIMSLTPVARPRRRWYQSPSSAAASLVLCTFLALRSQHYDIANALAFAPSSSRGNDRTGSTRLYSSVGYSATDSSGKGTRRRLFNFKSEPNQDRSNTNSSSNKFQRHRISSLIVIAGARTRGAWSHSSAQGVAGRRRL